MPISLYPKTTSNRQKRTIKGLNPGEEIPELEVLSRDFSQVGNVEGVLTLNVRCRELSHTMLHDFFDGAISNGLGPWFDGD